MHLLHHVAGNSVSILLYIPRRKMSTSVSLYDEEQFKDAIADVRADSTDTKWYVIAACVCVHVLPTLV